MVLVGNVLLAVAQMPAVNWGYTPLPREGAATPLCAIIDMTVDKEGNLLTLGTNSNHAVDMDPSTKPGDTNYTVFGNNYYFSKINSTGKLIYIKYFNKASGITMVSISPRKILVDNNNNPLIFIDYFGKMDANPSTAEADTLILTSKQPTYPDVAVIKFDAAGTLLWAMSLPMPSSGSNSLLASATINSKNELLVNTRMSGKVDLDPSTNEVLVTKSGSVFVKYSESGKYVQHTLNPINGAYGIPGYAIGTDAQNNTITASFGSEASTLMKVDDGGNALWTKTIGTGAYPYTNRTEIKGLTMASNGDFVIYGTFLNLMDFDLTAGFDTVRSASNLGKSYFIAKYNTDGINIWKKTFSNPVSFGNGFISSNGNFHWIGSISGKLTLDLVDINENNEVYGAFYAMINGNGKLVLSHTLSASSHYATLYPIGTTAYALSGTVGTNIDIDPTSANYVLNSTYKNGFIAVHGIPASTSLSSYAEKKMILIYPNPAQSQIGFGVTMQQQPYEIYNVMGQKIQKGVVSEMNQVRIEALKTGQYILKTRQGNCLFSKQ